MNPSQAARIAVQSRIAQGRTNTAPARAAFEARFIALVDPEGNLSPTELSKRVKAARSAHYSRLSAMRWAEKRNAEDDIASGCVWPEEVE